MFAGQVISGKMCWDVRIDFRIPEIVIDAIGDSHQTAAAGLQKPIKTVALFGCLNLARITGADG